ncbi:MAG TPA: clostripain-related cysteine peptidase, partial [bacterium]|nr:clostripain-related cysteine peptidase [bacterium]
MADLSDSSASGNYTISWTAGKDADSLKYYRLTEYRNAELIFSDNAENFNNWTNSGFSLNALHKKQGSYSFSSGSGYNQTKQITSGAIELPSTKSILMTYWCYSDNAGDNGGLKVNGINIDSISDKSISEEYRVVDLTQFAGQRVNLEFYNTFNNELGFDGDGYFIDDIKIWAYSGASFISQTISPSADSYQISDKAAGRYLYTIEGQDNQNNWGGVYGFKSISVPRCDVVIIDSAVQTENVIKGEQNSPVLIADITTYLDYDTITNFAIKNLGNANNADISKVKLWLAPNRNRAQFVGDEIFISNLEWNAGQAQWDTSAANLLPLVSGAARIIVTIDINSNANVNDTFVASVPQNTIASVRAPVGPATNKNESAIKTIQETYLKITKISELQSADVLRGDTNVTVMALKVIGNIPSDTITNFAVKNNGVMTNSDLDNVKLWFDADGDLRWSANDTYIGILNWNAAQSQWDTNSANIRLLSGVANILITIDINSNATFNRDFQALVQINSCTAQIIGTGPDTDLLNSGKFTLRSGKKWTVLVYINADNVTEADALVDFLEIAEVGSNNDMNIVAQLDRTPGNSTDYGDWEKTHRFYITQNMTPTETNAISNWGDGTGGREVNMADSNVLLDFINWTKNNYPADSYMLVIWNRLISKAVWRNNQQKTSVKRSIVTDWTYDGNGPVTMRMADFKAALEQSGIKFDVIGFDAPIAGTIEAAYDLKDLAYYMTASSKNIPAGGWPYNTILTSLKNNINTYTAANLASQIVERHFYKYSEAYENEEFVHAAYNLSAVQNLFDRINTFADELVKSQNDMAVAANIRADIVSNPQEIEDEDGPGDEPGSVDLYFYMNEFSSQSLSAAANLLANNVKSAIDAFVINRRSNPNATSEDYVNCRFVSIYFPFEYYNPVYSKVSTLGKNNKWSEFLRYFWTSKDQGPYNLQMAELSSTIPDSTLIINWSGVKDIDGISAYLLERYNNVNLLFSDNAEQGGANWILNGFSLTTKYKKSGQYSFASGEGFNTTKTMRTSAPINLPAGKKILLTYWYYADILNGDSATIAISADANNWLELKSYYDREISEEYETIDLSDSAGQSVYLRFSYGLNENLQFDGEGFFVDDIKIISYDDKISFAELSGGASAYTDTGLTPANYMYTISAKDSQNYYSDPQGFYIVNVNYAIDTPYINTISIYSGSMPNYYWTNDTPLIIADSTIAAGTTYFNGNYSQSLTFEIDWSSLSQKKLILGSNNFGNTNVSTTSAPWRLTYNNVSGAADTQITITVENYQSKTDTALIYMISDTFAPTIALQQPNNDSAILNNLIEFFHMKTGRILSF